MKPAGSIGSYAVYGLIVAAVWLGWEIAKGPIVERGPPALAIRLAPASPEVLRRSAETELAAGRISNARSLAEGSLTAAPFNARALRVLGLARARLGEADRADALLTLAGNWSLRDDPAHAWLIERRLREGRYGSAFAHADTLARRRIDGNEQIFNLFTTAVLLDSRAMPALAAAVARKPPWRDAYIYYLIARPDGDAPLLALGVALGENVNGYSDEELSAIYQSWYAENRFEAIRLLRTRVGRPREPAGLQDGDFDTPPEKALLPFGWKLDPAPGISAAMMEDEVRPAEIALRVEYDGYASGVVAEQILMLSPGDRTLAAQERIETSPDVSRLRWRVTCVESGQILGSRGVMPANRPATGWTHFSLPFTVPSTGCSVQRLRLETDAGDRRVPTVAWFDKLEISAKRLDDRE